MARDVVDVTIVIVDGQELEGVESFEIEETDPGSEPVKTMNRRRRAIGHKGGVPDYNVSIDARRLRPAEFDWHAYHRARRVFRIVYEEADGGDRYALVDCKITGISKSRNQDGEAIDRITIVALDHKPEA